MIIISVILKTILGAIFSGVLFVLLVHFLYKPTRDYFKSFFIVWRLLRETRPTRNALKGKHLADRLLDVWNVDKPLPLVSRDVLYQRGSWVGVWSERVVDKKLEEMNLVEIYESGGQTHVRLLDNLLTSFVVRRLSKLIKREKF